ncbi:hypothetical protein C8A03DRAFT_13160 [Achaetomium macrosporum]|uniref:Uncharacterized protein n=1 Tax=Achaetomium macrosporum TaxID=79813 RepID=A0AAN7CEE9_9PEZI|nr:hypothetical protein C8A03DRAFT_13160 [Achaetomium macrosporum]
MGQRGEPTIRILILGAAGVGKNCLESRLTTMTYPPAYNPALTLTSRRYFSLPVRPPDSCCSLLPAAGEQSSAPDGGQAYLIELVNDPSLQNPQVRAQVLANCEYNAVLLVYDIANRESFEAVPGLYAEIPLARGKRGHWRSLRRSCNSIFSRCRSISGAMEREGATEVVVTLVGNKCDVGNELDGPVLEECRSQHLLPGEAFCSSSSSSSSSNSDQCLSPLNSESTTSVPSPAHVTHHTRSASARYRAPLTLRLPFPSDDEHQEKPSLWPSRSRPLPQPQRQERAISLPELPFVNSVTAAPSTSTITTNAARTGSAPSSPIRASTNPAAQEPTVVSTRKVSAAEGEALARSLDANVAFFETSAETGANVEEVLEAIVRAVVGVGSGGDASAGGGGDGTGDGGSGRRHVRGVGSADEGSASRGRGERTGGWRRKERGCTDTMRNKKGRAAVRANGTRNGLEGTQGSPAAQRLRRVSILGWFAKAAMRRPAVGARKNEPVVL